jgi:hypothetical protein
LTKPIDGSVMSGDDDEETPINGAFPSPTDNTNVPSFITGSDRRRHTAL